MVPSIPHYSPIYLPVMVNARCHRLAPGLWACEQYYQLSGLFCTAALVNPYHILPFHLTNHRIAVHAHLKMPYEEQSC